MSAQSFFLGSILLGGVARQDNDQDHVQVCSWGLVFLGLVGAKIEDQDRSITPPPSPPTSSNQPTVDLRAHPPCLGALYIASLDLGVEPDQVGVGMIAGRIEEGQLGYWMMGLIDYPYLL